ncbi:MAG: hypothetical protein H7338_18220 [Candidatus Sericytochromatia bacterium]|nr:hypothetical protein [Candidatus Sericytochromatia bacterium]
MATLSLETTQTRTPDRQAEGYWLFGRKKDLGWFIWSLLIPLAVYLPAYAIWGKASIWPLYVIYVVAFATPHTWLTYAVSLPSSARGLYSRRSFWQPVLATAALATLVPFSQVYGGWDALFTFVTLLGFYHIGKQHVGILRMYDTKFAQVIGDRTIFTDLKPFHDFCVLAFAMPVLYVWLFPSLEIVVDRQTFTLLTPHIPVWSLIPIVAAMAWYALRTVQVLKRRAAKGKPLPSAHLATAAVACASYLIAFAAVRTEDYLLTLAIFITFHDIQYGGFVWHFQRQRAQRAAQAGQSLDRIHLWAKDNRYGRYFGLALAFSVGLVGLLSIVPATVALTIVVFHNTLHYLMDGWIWKRQNNPTVHLDLGIANSAAD